MMRIHLMLFVLLLTLVNKISMADENNKIVNQIKPVNVKLATLKESFDILADRWNLSIQFKYEHINAEEIRDTSQLMQQNVKSFIFNGSCFWEDYLNISEVYSVGLRWFVSKSVDGSSVITISTNKYTPHIIKAFYSEKFCIGLLDSSTYYSDPSKKNIYRDIVFYSLPQLNVLDFTIHSKQEDIITNSEEAFFGCSQLVGRIPFNHVDLLNGLEFELVKAKFFDEISLDLLTGKSITISGSQGVSRIEITQVKCDWPQTDNTKKPYYNILFNLYGSYVAVNDYYLLDRKNKHFRIKENYSFTYGYDETMPNKHFTGKYSFYFNPARKPAKIVFKVPVKVEKQKINMKELCIWELPNSS